MQSLARKIRDVSGWRRWLIATAAGAVSVLAMAPFFAWPVLFVTLPVLVWLIDGPCVEPIASATVTLRWRERAAVRAAAAGWLFGFGYFVAGLFWIGEAFLVEAEKFAVLLPLAVTLLPAGLALFWAGATAIASLRWRPGWTRIVSLSVTLAGAEWLRGHVFTGLPWNVLGYALTWPLALMQAAAAIGIYGLTLLAIPVFAAPAVRWADCGDARARPALKAAGVAVLVLLVLAAGGWARLWQAEPEAIERITARLVQPSVPQREKWRPENQERIFLQHLQLSATSPSGVRDGAAGINLIIWPEAAMPFLPLAAPRALAAIGGMLPRGGHLISGALRVEEPAGAAERRRVYNSLMVFDDLGRLAGLYDKIHLVPFGEYLPLQGWLEAIGLEQLTRIRGGFHSGITPRPLLNLPGTPAFGPLICYEAIFPGEIVQGRDRPAVLVNVTNDGWFGNTTGPRQHLHQARVRAVEEGLPLLRVANNGISAVIDAKGRVLGRLDLDVPGVIDTRVPPALSPPFYARVGDLPFAAAWVLAAAWLSASGLLGRPKRTSG